MLLLVFLLAAQNAVDRPVAYSIRDRVTGVSSLRANSALLKSETEFTVAELWRYSPERRTWFKLAFTKVGPKKIAPAGHRVYSTTTDPIVAPLTDRLGLYWVKWTENGQPFGTFVYSGPMLCEDIMIGPMTKGDMVATCIPSANSALAAYVPDPKIYCK
jgi:hypothetical protein